MKAILILVLFIIGTACQSGRIPCPEVKIAKAKKSKATQSTHWYAALPQKEEAKTQTGKGVNPRYVKNVSLEEWDCPRPGKKKYLPKSVKENIRENLKKVKSQQNTNEANSSQATSN